ncbi:MAG: recombination protein NinB [Usitatibacter sp.]
MKINKLFIVRDASILARAISFVSTLLIDAKHPWCIYVGPESKLRTRAQNDLLWAIYTEIADATGFSKDDLHEYFKRRFLGVEVKDIWGTKLETVRSTTQLSTIDFSDFVECVIACAAEQGIVIQTKPKQVIVG